MYRRSAAGQQHGVPLCVPRRLVPKYRRKVISRDADTRLKKIIRQVREKRGAHITGPETMPDHVRLLVECDPQYGIHRLVKQIKRRQFRLEIGHG